MMSSASREVYELWNGQGIVRTSYYGLILRFQEGVD